MAALRRYHLACFGKSAGHGAISCKYFAILADNGTTCGVQVLVYAALLINKLELELLLLEHVGIASYLLLLIQRLHLVILPVTWRGGFLSL